MRKEKARFLTRYDKVQQHEKTDLILNEEGETYAILFNADEGDHFKDMHYTYNSLIQNNVPDQNIAFMEGKGPTLNRFAYPATVESLENILDKIREKATPQDKLLVYITNHGNSIGGRCNIETQNGVIWEEDFEKMMQNLPVNFSVFYFAQCFSGAFSERMGLGKNIAIASSNKFEESRGIQKYNSILATTFTYFLFPKLLEPNVTVEQAFDYAVYENTSFLRVALGIGRTANPIIREFHYPLHYGKETPQLRWQNADPSELYLGTPPGLKK